MKDTGQTAFDEIFRSLLRESISFLQSFYHIVIPPLQPSIERKSDSSATSAEDAVLCKQIAAGTALGDLSVADT